ncbi:beta-2-microglobulin-like isoform X1 [Nerophis ophidion]|uniref:beta-2-microglobulin-like isoform X1 n=1 Tax=Nerophis ophidion TaxID=159077 RepID=UPI002ADF5358|nr:beta-2-microglobulin-like isoform X1 [Nerophis ophidion]
MKVPAFLLVLAAVYWVVDSKFSPPKVHVYSANPAMFGEQNMVICHVSEFHPPDIHIKLFKNGKEIKEAVLTDLSFKKNWHFHLTKHVETTLVQGDKFMCEVIHGTSASKYFDWEVNM